MKYELEEILFNSKFNDPPFYIFKNNEIFYIIHYVNHYPFSIKIFFSSSNINEILENGKIISKKNSYPFIQDTIFY